MEPDRVFVRTQPGWPGALMFGMERGPCEVRRVVPVLLLERARFAMVDAIEADFRRQLGLAPAGAGADGVENAPVR